MKELFELIGSFFTTVYSLSCLVTVINLMLFGTVTISQFFSFVVVSGALLLLFTILYVLYHMVINND